MGAPQYEQAGADIGGTGTTNTIPRWTGPSTLGDSLLSQSGAIVTNSGTFRADSGAVSEPAYTFSASSGTGMYRATSGALLRFAVSGAYAFGVDTNGYVGIANTSPSSASSQGRLLVLGDGTGASPGLTIFASAAGSGSLIFANSAGGFQGGFQYAHSVDHLRFITASVTRWVVNNSGHMLANADATYDVGTSTGFRPRTVYATSGFDASSGTGGLKLPATPGNTDPNTLDAYVDGGTPGSGGATFTATLKGLVSDPTTPVTTTGKYILVGKLLIMTIVFSNVNTTGAAGAIYVQTNLAAALRPERSHVGSVTLDSIATITGVGTHVIANAAGDIYVAQNTSNAAVSFCTHNAGAARGLTITVSYMIP